MNPNFLDFEQPIADLQAKIEELRLVGNDNSLNISDEISRLQDKSKTLTEDIFGKLTSWQIARLARRGLTTAGMRICLADCLSKKTRMCMATIARRRN